MDWECYLGGSEGKAALDLPSQDCSFRKVSGGLCLLLGSVVVWMIAACMGLGFFVQILLLPQHVVDTGDMCYKYGKKMVMI